MEPQPPDPSDATVPSAEPRPRFGRRRAKARKPPLADARARVLSGLLLIVPFVVTFIVAGFLYRVVSETIAPATVVLRRVPLVSRIAETSPELLSALEFGAAVVIGIAILYGLGALSTLFVARRLHEAGERLMLRIPLLREVYGLTKQVSGLISSKDQVAFKQLALVDVAGTGTLLFAFVTGESRSSDAPDRVLVHALMPFSPIPTQLVLFVVPADRVRIVDVPFEQAMKLVMSGGAVSPPEFRLSPYVPTADREGDQDDHDPDEDDDDDGGTGPVAPRRAGAA